MSEGSTRLEEPKTGQVLTRIRAGIVSGRYAPGLRLPTFAEMETDFAVGRAVIQNAVDELKREGFIRSEGRRGLYVAQNPPHLCQYGLVLPAVPGDPGWGQLMTALNNEAQRIERTDGQKRFRFYYGVPGESSKKALAQLSDDLQAHRLAGLIISRESAEAVADVARRCPPVPQVHLWANSRSGILPPTLTVSGTSLLRRALEFFKQRKRSRVAIVNMAGINIDADYRSLFAEAGIEYHAPWIQWVGRSDPATAEHVVALLMDYPPAERPDGLIIGDDNLVPYASRGLVAAGIKVGDDVEVVAHCNWPWPPHSVLPMVRIGFDLREVMRRAIATLTLQQEGKTPEPYQSVEPQFESETHSFGT